MSGGALATYQYMELSGIRFVPKSYTGTLELIPALDEFHGWVSRPRGDVQKRDDALQLSKELYEKAHDRPRAGSAGRSRTSAARRIPTSRSWTS